MSCFFVFGGILEMAYTKVQVTNLKREAKELAEVLDEDMNQVEGEFWTHFIEESRPKLLEKIKEKNSLIEQLKKQNHHGG